MGMPGLCNEDKKMTRWVATGTVLGASGVHGYGFYTNLLNYVDWIKKEMEVEN